MSDVQTTLVLRCVECDENAIQTPTEILSTPQLVPWLFDHGKWVLSVVSGPGEHPVRMAPLCEPCSRRVHDKRLLSVAHNELNKGRPS